MTSSLSARLRRLWLDVHLWIGVGLLIAIVPISASGAILVWKAPLDRMMHADRYAVSGEAMLPAGRYAAAAPSRSRPTAEEHECLSWRSAACT